MYHKIYPIHLGGKLEDRSVLFYRGAMGEKIAIQDACFYVKSEDGENILIDTGGPARSEIIEKGYPLPLMEGAPEHAEDIWNNFDINPEDITTIILTHLHWDHSWNLGKYPNAKIYVQRKELQHAVAPFPHEMGSFGLRPQMKDDVWLNFHSRMIPVDGDTTFKPGIRGFLTPGHTNGSQTILIDTREGTYAICGDYCFTYENLYDRKPVGPLSDIAGWYESYKRVKEYMDQGVKFLPNHEAKVFERTCYG